MLYNGSFKAAVSEINAETVSLVWTHCSGEDKISHGSFFWLVLYDENGQRVESI